MSKGNLERIHLYVSGVVQGVGFRYHALRAADSLGLRGWVRNLADSRVEITAEGKTEALEELLRWCAHGPPKAKVTNVEVEARSPIEDFEFMSFEIT